MASSLLTVPGYAALFAVAVAAWVGLNLRLVRRGREDVRRESSASRWILAATVGLGFGVAAVASEAAPGAAMGSPAVAYWLGLSLLVAGAALRERAVRTLGADFTLDLAVDADQAVVSSGPYAWVRHPSYAGAAASFAGIGLALANWASLAVVLLAVLVGYGYRIRVEERLLRRHLGDRYESYAEETPDRLIPGLW